MRNRIEWAFPILLAIPFALVAGEKPKAIAPEERLADLGARLHSPDSQRRADAAMDLQKMGEPAVPILSKALENDDDPGAQLAAASALAKMGATAKPAVPGLIRILKSPKRIDIHSAIASSLQEIGPAAIPDLVATVKTDEPLLFRNVARILGELGPGGKDAVPALVAGLQKKDDDETRIAALAGLSGIGEPAAPAVPIMMPLLAHHRLRMHVEQTLQKIGPTAIPDILPALQDREPLIRRIALGVLASYGPKALPALAEIRKALQDEDADVRNAAIRALGGIGADAASAVPDLLSMLENDAMRPAAYSAMMRMGPGAVDALIQGTKDSRPGVRLGAVRGLGMFRTREDEIVAALRAAMKEDALRLEAIRGLQAFGPKAKEAVPELAKALRSQEALMRLETGSALRLIGPAALPALLEGMKDPALDVRRVSLQAIAGMEPPQKEAIPQLVLALDEKDRTMRHVATAALARLGTEAKEAIPVLLKAMDDPDPTVRSGAILAIGKVGPETPEAVPKLVAAFRDETAYVRDSAATSLQAMAQGAVPKLPEEARAALIPALVEALKAKHDEIRLAAVMTLGAIGPKADAGAGEEIEKILGTKDNQRLAKAAERALEKIRKKAQ
ncbi:MAG: HEAT repeat domain-containing protein [Planctomycetota bacterium]